MPIMTEHTGQSFGEGLDEELSRRQRELAAGQVVRLIHPQLIATEAGEQDGYAALQLTQSEHDERLTELNDQRTRSRNKFVESMASFCVHALPPTGELFDPLTTLTIADFKDHSGIQYAADPQEALDQADHYLFSTIQSAVFTARQTRAA